MADDTNTPLFGQPSVSKEALEHRRQLALQLIKQGSDTSPVLSKWQGAARAMQNIMGNIQLGMEERSESEARKRQHDTLRDLAEKAGYTGAQADLIAATASANFVPQTDILHKLSETAMPRYGTISTSSPTGSANVPTQQPALMGGPGQAPQLPRAGGPVQPPQPQTPYRTTDQQVISAPNQGSSIPPQAERDLAKASDMQRQQGTLGLIRQANEKAWNEDVNKAVEAPTRRQQLRLLEQTIASYDPTRGDAGSIINRVKQTVNGLVGSDNVLGETRPAEFMTALGGILSREAAGRSRNATDYSLSSAREEIPGGLQGSKEGNLALVRHLIQMTDRDEKLGHGLSKAFKSDPDNYISKRSQWLDDPNNALTNPLTGRSTSGQTQSGPNLKGPPNKGWSAIQTSP